MGNTKSVLNITLEHFTNHLKANGNSVCEIPSKLKINKLGFPALCYQNAYYYCQMMNEKSSCNRFKVVGGWNITQLPHFIKSAVSWTAEIHMIVCDTKTSKLYDVTEDFDGLTEKWFIQDKSMTNYICNYTSYSDYQKKIIIWKDYLPDNAGFLNKNNYKQYNPKNIYSALKNVIFYM